MQEINLAREQVVTAGPGLTALVGYLRPSARGPLLSTLSELGVLVVECVGDHWARAWSSGRADFAVVVADDSGEHLGMFTEIAQRTAAPVLALTPSKEQFGSFERAGALACAAEADGLDQLAEPVKQVAREARRLQSQPRASSYLPEPQFTVFQDIQFHVDPPFLVRQARSVALSHSECDALLALSERMGAPVSTEDMEQRLSRRCGTVSSGYVKTIVLRIRRKVDSIGGDSAVLGAVRGFGYVLRN